MVMNIKILDSWLRDYLKTNAAPQKIAENLSLSSVSVERLEKYNNNDFIYDIEVTTNRPDLMSVIGLAREAAAVLPQNGFSATFISPKITLQTGKLGKKTDISVINDPKLVNRICAVVMEVKIGKSPSHIQKRLESTDIRSLNNLIDITNYVMRVIGHPAHVFDYDRLSNKKIIIRESKKGEKIITLDNKIHILRGGDIIAESGGQIIDLLGIMGLENSVVTDKTKRILFFIDNNDPARIRRTSMSLAIRSEAAQINEKSLDAELAKDALLYGIQLFTEIAQGKIISDIIDIYSNQTPIKEIKVNEEQINTITGVKIPLQKSQKILTSLGFQTIIEKDQLVVTPPSFRAHDISIPEDIIEEIARVYGYYNIPSTLPQLISNEPYHIEKNEFYWEDRIKDALKYWGFTEVYTYSMVSENMFEGPKEEAVTLQNPLSEDYTFMRKSLVPGLLQVVKDDKETDRIDVFEIANVYLKRPRDLPDEKLKLAGVMKKKNISFFEVKGLLEQLLTDLGINNISFHKSQKENLQVAITIEKESLGNISILNDRLASFELDFETIIKYATTKKVYKPVSKYPPVYEDMALIVPEDITVSSIIDTIKKQSALIDNVSLLDKYDNTRTFHITYRSYNKNLTSEEITPVRKKILQTLKTKYKIFEKLP